MQLDVMCNSSYATTQICSCMCRMQLNFSYKRQLQNPKFLVVILVTFQDLLELLSLLLIQVMINSNLLVDLFPPCAHFMIVKQFQLLTAIVVEATVLCFMNL